MRKTASFRIKMLSRTCTDPEVADKMMRETIKWGITKVQRHLRVIKLGKLMKRGIGTALVEKMTDMLTADARENMNSRYDIWIYPDFFLFQCKKNISGWIQIYLF